MNRTDPSTRPALHQVSTWCALTRDRVDELILKLDALLANPCRQVVFTRANLGPRKVASLAALVLMQPRVSPVMLEVASDSIRALSEEVSVTEAWAEVVAFFHAAAVECGL